MASGADVQVENGNWAKIHNLILKALAKADLTGREAKCLFFLLSMTYGKQEKVHEISLTLWADGTGIDKRHVKPIVDRLIERNIIKRVDGAVGRGHTAIYGFNKYFELWDCQEKVPSTVPIEKVLSEVPFIDDEFEEKVPSTVPEKVPSTVPTKERREESCTAAELPKNSISAFAKAYQDILGKMVESRIRSEEIQDWETRVPYPAWEYALHEALDRGHRHDWKYTTRILERLEREGYQPKGVTIPSSATVNFAIEDFTP